MKKIYFAVMLMMSLVVISCSKEDDYPVGLQYKQMYLDTCEIKFPFEMLPMGGDNHRCFYQIEIPREGAELTLLFDEPEYKFDDI